jgi:hypothetical protein
VPAGPAGAACVLPERVGVDVFRQQVESLARNVGKHRDAMSCGARLGDASTKKPRGDRGF